MAFVTPSRDYTDGTLVFSAGSDTRVSGLMQFPHRWKVGSRQWPHVHYFCTTSGSGTIKWTFEYDIAKINGDFQGSYTLMDKTANAPESSVKHCLTSFGFVEMTDYGISTIMQWRVARLGSEDTYAGDVKLMYFDTHIEIDSLGSTFEFSKP